MTFLWRVFLQSGLSLVLSLRLCGRLPVSVWSVRQTFPLRHSVKDLDRSSALLQREVHRSRHLHQHRRSYGGPTAGEGGGEESKILDRTIQGLEVVLYWNRSINLHKLGHRRAWCGEVCGSIYSGTLVYQRLFRREALHLLQR